MTTRNLDALFAPRAVALIGANPRPGSVGHMVTRNLREAGFPGRLMLVNREGAPVDGVPVCASIADLPEAPDLAVIATPAAAAPGLVAELGDRGCRAAVVLSAGFEGEGRPAELRQALLDAARPHLLRIVGPNCLGVLSPAAKLNASFARAMPPEGRVALVAQSGAVAAAAMDWAPAHGLGFSHVVTIGDCADVDVADLLDHLALDDATDAVLLYIEGIGDGRKFMSAARIAAAAKPVAVLKAGRSASGVKAALSHTGALAGAYAVYEAALRRAGLLQVESLGALLRAGTAFQARVTGADPRAAILTNGGGAGVLAVDALEALGERVAELGPDTIAALNAVAPPNWSRGDPVDILGDAPPETYRAAAAILAEAAEVDALIVLNCPTAVTDSVRAADAVAAGVAGRLHKPVLAAWLGGDGMAAARRRLCGAGLPAYDTPEDAAEVFAHLTELRRRREALRHAAYAPAQIYSGEARRIVSQALNSGRALLTDPETRAVLRAYGVPTVASHEAATPEAAGDAARRLGGPVALKILSPDITHKTDVGGVRLGLVGGEATERAAREMLAVVALARPGARIEGFTIEPMVARSHAQEMLAGLVQDPTFGPVVMVGHGGVAVELLADRVIGLPPLDDELARDMIGRTRVSRLLVGHRGRPPADLAALAACLVALGRMAVELPEVAELDINPLLCDETGVLALDARMTVRPVGPATPRLSILPYPAELARDVVVGDETLRIRPLRPDDSARVADLVDRSSPDDVRLRFGGGMRHLTPDLLARLTQLDYDRHLALAAEDASGAFLGVVRLLRDPEGESGEFALMVRTDHQGRGLGRLLLQAALAYAESIGLREVWGDVARQNSRMLGLAASLGFTPRQASDLARIHMTKRLAPKLAPA